MESGARFSTPINSAAEKRDVGSLTDVSRMDISGREISSLNKTSPSVYRDAGTQTDNNQSSNQTQTDTSNVVNAQTQTDVFSDIKINLDCGTHNKTITLEELSNIIINVLQIKTKEG